MSAGAIRRTDDSDHRLSIFWFRLWTKLVGRRGEIGATQPSQPKGPGGKHQHPTEHVHGTDTEGVGQDASGSDAEKTGSLPHHVVEGKDATPQPVLRL